MKIMDTNTVFTQYLSTVNRAIGEHRDELPYKQIVELGEKMLGDKRMGVAVYKEDADTPHDWFTIGMQNGTLRLLDHGKKNPDVKWKVKQSHMETVVKNPEEYIKHPYKLDLHWLTSRMGIN